MPKTEKLKPSTKRDEAKAALKSLMEKANPSVKDLRDAVKALAAVMGIEA